MPLADALPLHAVQTPEKLAACDLSYAALWARACQIYAGVAALPRIHRDVPELQGLPVFALLVGNHPAAISFLAAAAATPCCVVLMDASWPAARVADVMARVCPDALITTKPLGAGLPSVPCPVFYVEDAPFSGEAAIPPRPADDAPFLMAFTSGTTSQPKAFLRKRRDWRLSLVSGRNHFGLSAATNTMSPGPLAHGLSLYALMETLEVGASFYTIGRFDAVAVSAMVAQHGIERFVGVPSMLAALRQGAALPSLVNITTAGARLDDAVVARVSQAAPNADIVEYYGASELGFVTSSRHPSVGVGQAFPGVTIDIRQDGKSVPQGTVGMIWLRTPLAIDGYVWHDGTTGFRRDGDWVSVGDLGRMDAAGNLFLLGRGDNMVITGGYNVYPDEVAAVLRTHDAIADAYVIGMPDDYLGTKLVAVLSAQLGPVPDIEAVMQACADALPRYKIPRQFWVATEWPLTPSGKVAQAMLATWIGQHDKRLVPL